MIFDLDSKNYIPSDPVADGWVAHQGLADVDGVNVRDGDILFVAQNGEKFYSKKPSGHFETANELAAYNLVQYAGVPVTNTSSVIHNGTIRLASKVRFERTMEPPFEIDKFSNAAAFQLIPVVNVFNFNTDCPSSKFDSFAVDYRANPPCPWYQIDFGNTLTHPDGSHFDGAIAGLNLSLHDQFGFALITDFSQVKDLVESLEAIPRESFEKLAYAVAEGLSQADATFKDALYENAEKQVKIWLWRRGKLREWFLSALTQNVANH